MPISKNAPAKTYVLVLLVILTTTLLTRLIFGHPPSSDLKALWIAGEFFAQGDFDQMYPADTTHFTMTPPSEWSAHLHAQGHIGDVYPYIYAPIWAAIAAEATDIFTFTQVSRVASFVNPLLIGAMVFLAWRISDKRVSAPFFTAIGVVIITVSIGGMLALFQNQPQILVSFLILLGIERSVHGDSRSAGAALGLAAALKLYPLIIALFLVARGDRRSLLSFAIVGGGLGLVSILLTGWPLHALFLHQISTISAGAVVKSFSFSLDATIANVFFQDALEFIPALTFQSSANGLSELVNNDNAGWYVIEKTVPWRIFSTCLYFGTILILCFLFYRRPNEIAVWPFAIALLALVSPLSWAYHFFPCMAFAPMLMERLKIRYAAPLLVIFFAACFFSTYKLYSSIPSDLDSAQLVGTLVMVAYCGVWGYVVFKRVENTA